MIVFTISNTVTKTVYVGTTNNSVEERWAQLQLAMELPIKAPLYKDMRDLGVDCFSAEEYAVADSREELAELFEEAMSHYEGTSLKGLKMTAPKTAPSEITSAFVSQKAKVSKPALKPKPTIAAVATPAPGVEKLKLATGRTGSAIKERNIKEAITKEKEQREELKSRQIAEQADEMKAIMARLDARGSTLRRR